MKETKMNKSTLVYELCQLQRKCNELSSTCAYMASYCQGNQDYVLIDEELLVQEMFALVSDISSSFDTLLGNDLVRMLKLVNQFDQNSFYKERC